MVDRIDRLSRYRVLEWRLIGYARTTPTFLANLTFHLMHFHVSCALVRRLRVCYFAIRAASVVVSCLERL